MLDLFIGVLAFYLFGYCIAYGDTHDVGFADTGAHLCISTNHLVQRTVCRRLRLRLGALVLQLLLRDNGSDYQQWCPNLSLSKGPLLVPSEIQLLTTSRLLPDGWPSSPTWSYRQ